MKDRIKEIRKYFKETQQSFADKLSLSKANIEAYEYGRVKEIPERTLKDICRIYGVSWNWITTGEGDMLVPKDRSTEIADLTERLMSDEPEQLRTAFTNVLCGLTEAQIIALYDIAKKTVEEVEKSLSD